MADSTTPSTKTPWHLWLVGVLALRWNAMGALDFTMTLLKNETYLKDFTPEQRAFFYAFPVWAMIAWGVGTWGGFLGSLFVLLRKKCAVQLFGASLVGIVFTNIYSYGLSDWTKVMKSGTGAMIFSAVIFVIGGLLFLYARALCKRSVLH